MGERHERLPGQQRLRDGVLHRVHGGGLHGHGQPVHGRRCGESCAAVASAPLRSGSAGRHVPRCALFLSWKRCVSCSVRQVRRAVVVVVIFILRVGVSVLITG